MLLPFACYLNNVFVLGVEKRHLIFTAWSPAGKSIPAVVTEFESSSEKTAVTLTLTKS